MKILITGTHFTVAQAVIEELLKDPGNEIVYVGRKYTMEGVKIPSVESKVLPEKGVKFIPIIAGRLRRFLSVGTFISLLKVPIGFIQSFLILLQEKPDIVVSFGGYTGVPIVISGWLLSIPIMLHEQTLVSGLSNTISGNFADKVAVSFDTKYNFPKQKVIYTGNPIRDEVLQKSTPSLELKNFLDRNKNIPLIYVTGGSQGSHIINETLLKILPKLLEHAAVIHQTGDSKFKDFEKIEKVKDTFKNGKRYMVSRWYDASDVSTILRQSDLVVSRAGANTLLELSYFAKPVVVIPIPYLHKNEQVVNAIFFENLGLCQIIYQKDLNAEKLDQVLESSLSDLDHLKKQAKNSSKVVVKDAAKILAQQIIILAHTKNSL